MAKFFTIASGLRGGFTPDSVNPVIVKTRRELRDALECEARDIVDAGFHLNKRDVSRIAAAAWAEAKKPNPTIYDFVIPYGRSHVDGRPFGILVTVSSKEEFENA